jgi:hypothetical protein
MELLKIDRRDGIVAERFAVGSKEYRDETARAAKLLFDNWQTDPLCLSDFRQALERGQEFATAAFVYRVA